MSTWSTSDEKKPEANGGRLDDSYKSPFAPMIDDLEMASYAITSNEHKYHWTFDDLTKLRRVISRMDAVGERIERKL